MFVGIKKTLTLAVIGISLSFYTQAQESLYKAGQHYFENLSYVKAIEALESAISKKGISEAQKLSAKIMLAESYTKIKDSQNAERVYKEIIDEGADLTGENAVLLLKYAQALASNGNYDRSQLYYDDYMSKVESDPRGKNFSKLYNDVTVLNKNAACYKVDYLSINTNAADFSPTYFKDGMVFISNRKNTSGVRRVFTWNNTPFLDMFYLDDVSSLGSTAAGLGAGNSNAELSKKRKSDGTVGNDEYTAPTANDSKTIGTYGGTNIGLGYGYGDKPLTESDRFDGTLNSKYHEGPMAFFKDGSKVIFTRNNFINGKTAKSSDGINKLKLYMANSEKDSWGNLVELPFNSDEYSSGHPALSPDEKLLFFSSDMPGGYGGTDIYVSRYDEGNWSAPINLGASINTKGNEMFPFVDDKANLYFSSDGHPGLGDLDIFFVQLNEMTPKGRVINLGTPINSSKDDFGILTDGTRQNGYFSSNRKRGGNDDDIYKFERECELKEGCPLIIAIYDAETKMPLDNAKVEFIDALGNVQEYLSDADGSIALDDLDSDHEFTFNATRDAYNPNSVSYSTTDCDSEPSRIEIPLSLPAEEIARRKRENEMKAKALADGKTTDGEDGNINGSGYTDGTAGQNSCKVIGRILAQKTGLPLSGAVVTIKNECDGSLRTSTTDASGYYEFSVAEGCDFEIEASKAGLASKGKRVSKINCANGDITADIMMFGQGDIVAIDNIYFDYGKCNIRSDARVGLDKVLKIMRENPGMKIEIASHTDSRSSFEFNEKISAGRAKASAEYLFKRGVSRNRITFKGYGETKLVNQCADGVSCTEAQHQQNRRSEFTILQMN